MLRRPFLIIAGALWLTALGLAALLVVVDPYGLYRAVPDGAPLRFESQHAPWLIRRMARDRAADVVLIGSSPTAMVTPDDMHLAYPDAHAPLNASYHGQFTTDRLVVMREFAAHPTARRYIVTADFFLAGQHAELRPDFPTFAYDASWRNDYRWLDLTALRAARSVHGGGPPFPGNDAATAWERAQNVSMWRAFHTQDNWAALGRAMTLRDATLQRKSIACTDFPALPEFVDLLRALTRRGAELDVLIPVYAPTHYFEIAASARRSTTFGGAILERQLAFRGCLVGMLESTVGAKVFAADQDASFAGDIDHFRDAGHLYGRTNILHMLRAANDPANRLTPATFPAYRARVRAMVANFRLKAWDPAWAEACAPDCMPPHPSAISGASSCFIPIV